MLLIFHVLLIRVPMIGVSKIDLLKSKSYITLGIQIVQSR